MLRYTYRSLLMPTDDYKVSTDVYRCIQMPEDAYIYLQHAYNMPTDAYNMHTM